MNSDIAVRPVTGKADLKTFVDIAYRLNADDPNWVPPLRSDVFELLNPDKNPFHKHATVQLFLAWRGGKAVGRISAHIDHLALEQPVAQGMGPGTGNWGLFEAEDEAVAAALLAATEQWLRGQGMTRSLGPLSLSVWEEPGLLTKGHDHPAMVMMGHDKAEYQGWIEGQHYSEAKQLYTYRVPVSDGFPPLIQRIVQSGERNERITIRPIDMNRYEEEAELILGMLNEAWSGNWGFVPIPDYEVVYIRKKLKPAIIPQVNLIAEYEGEPAAFMLALPDVNEVLRSLGGSLLPFGWARLLYRLWKKQWKGHRVPLMGVSKKHQNSRLASQLAFMMIEKIRAIGVRDYGAVDAEVGWILEDNQGMVAIADAINAEINRVYTIYEKPL
ncbi:N-acetyltransferase [Parasphingopyxis marina]|uniref:N-acetyltransferase n=1 Tax=Parasphingopyxis marina TaxID=2761622 RepID=A0A842HZR3_9SPHN|nr:N-acetyltransferase [Parasphingopyxis marina]MBC2776994.1 N-acetyltransferase [Parasphingopyxis marina]